MKMQKINLNIQMATSCGLVKTVNEDAFKFKVNDHSVVIVLCDGHWGDSAAKLAAESLVESFPRTRHEAILSLRKIERRLYDQFNKTNLTEADRPPETSVLGVEIDIGKGIAKIISYGDCRFIHERDGQIIFQNSRQPTWLGAFSFKQIRGRQPAENGLKFDLIKIEVKDSLILFSDGVDQCKYERDTISYEEIIASDVDQIFQRIKLEGAEDNATLIKYKC